MLNTVTLDQAVDTALQFPLTRLRFAGRRHHRA